MNRNLTLCIALVCGAITACNKPAAQSVTKFTTSDTNFVISNKYSQQLHVDLYTSNADYISHTNRKYAAVVPSKGIFKLPFSQLDTTAIYYYDIYTDGYVWSTWGNNYNYMNGHLLFYQGHKLAVDSATLTTGRHSFLGDNDASATWIAVDLRAYDNTSQWSTLDNNTRYMQVVLNSNQTGTIKHKQTGGAMNTYNILSVYMSSNFSANTICTATLNTDLTGSEYSFINIPVVPNYNTGNRSSRDTILLADYSNAYWVMVRQ